MKLQCDVTVAIETITAKLSNISSRDRTLSPYHHITLYNVAKTWNFSNEHSECIFLLTSLFNPIMLVQLNYGILTFYISRDVLWTLRTNVGTIVHKGKIVSVSD
jgi:hypothetical protein